MSRVLALVGGTVEVALRRLAVATLLRGGSISLGLGVLLLLAVLLLGVAWLLGVAVVDGLTHGAVLHDDRLAAAREDS